MDIIFRPTSKLMEQVVSSPKPAKEYLPSWFKSKGAFETKKPSFSEKGDVNSTFKMCMPFTDSMTSGYIQETWQDIYIESNEQEIKFYHPSKPDIISIRGEKSKVVIGKEFIDLDFVWHPSWTPNLPKGWSMLYTHPLNRIDLPFYTFSGVIDSDTFIESNPKSNIPFSIKKNFSGIIPKGTPMYQMIPIKRESWNRKEYVFDEENNIKEVSKIRQYFWGAYKKNNWIKKEYN